MKIVSSNILHQLVPNAMSELMGLVFLVVVSVTVSLTFLFSKFFQECLIALEKHWHSQCFACSFCKCSLGRSTFFLEDGQPYCEKDWNELFTTKCISCGFPIEAGDRWVEALNNNYHSQCFKCTVCQKNLEGQSFFAKGGRPFCKAHAR